MTRLLAAGALVVALTPITAWAQGSYRNASVAASASAGGKTIGTIDNCSDTPPGVAPAPGQGASVPATCQGTATHDGQTVIATSSSSASIAPGGSSGSDRFGRPLFSSISLTESVKAKVEFTGGMGDPQLGGGAGSTAIVQLEIVVETGTPYTVTVAPSGTAEVEAKMNNALFSGSVNRTTTGVLDVRAKALVPDSVAPGGGEVEGSVAITISFGTIPPIGACCRASCFVDTSVACDDAAGTFKGGGTTCNPNPCVAASGSPTPTPTATPQTVIVWNNAAGGDFGTAMNWTPPKVPTSTTQSDDTAVFDIVGTYRLNVSGARAKRFVIRDSSIDLVGGSAEVTSRVPGEPSLTVGQNGRLHLVSGVFTSVDGVLGDVSGGGLAEVDLISDEPFWDNTGRLTIGDAGPGRLTVVSGHAVSGEARIGGGLLGPGEAIVGGPGKWTTGDLGLGFGGGAATLEIRDDGVVTSTAASIGVTADADVTVTDAEWTTGNLAVGRGGVGTLTIVDGSLVDSDDAFIGFESTPGSDVTVDGAGSQLDSKWTVSGRLVVGSGPLQQPSDLQPDATLQVLNGAHVVAHDLEISAKGDGQVVVADAEGAVTSLVEVENLLVFGPDVGASGGQGTLSLEGGGELHAKQAKIGGFNFAVLGVFGRSPGGAPSRLQVQDELFIGVLGGALAEIRTGGRVVSGTGAVASFEASRNATVLIGSPDAAPEPTSRWSLGGDLLVGSSQAQGESTVVVHRTGEITSTGVGAAVRLRETSTLAGGGRIGMNVVVQGGRVAPLDPQTHLPTRLTIAGDLAVDAGVVRVAVVGTAAGFFDTIAVGGNARLGGTLEIVFANGFVPQSGDAFAFLEVGGTVTGGFAQVRLLGVQQGLPFTLTPSGIVIGAVAPRAALPTNALVLTALADGVPCAVSDQDGDGVAECETCDDCVDDNANGLIDAADPDCVPPADGGGNALAGSDDARKGLVACQKGLRIAAAKLGAATRKGLAACASAVAACRLEKPDDAACVAKAAAACGKRSATLGDAAGSAGATFAAKARKACGAIAFADLLAPQGLGFAAATARCARFGILDLDGVDALARCLAREERCRAAELVRDAIPNLVGLAAAGGVAPELLACVADGGPSGGTAAGLGAKPAKALRKCQAKIAAAAEKLAGAIAKSREGCAAGMLACRQLATDPAPCTVKLALKCESAAAKLGDAAAGSGAAGKAIATVAKACASVPLADVLAAGGLGFGARAADCAARGVATFAASTDVARCVATAVRCRVEQRLEAGIPRFRELVELGR